MPRLLPKEHACLQIVSRNSTRTPLTVAAVAFDEKDGYYHAWLAKDGIVAGYSMFELLRGGKGTVPCRLCGGIVPKCECFPELRGKK
jgi:hypothetical protein